MDQFEPPEGPPPNLAAPADHADEDVSGMTDDELMFLLNEIKDYQLMHGSLMKRFEAVDPGMSTQLNPSSVVALPIGVSVQPNSFPRRLFEEALEMQRAFNELYVRAAADEEWLHGVLAPLFEHDEFLTALWEVHLKVKEAGSVQDITCGIFRSDYMLDSTQSNLSLKQVEMNTFSVAGACHSERVAGMHHHLQRIQKGSGSGLTDELAANRNIEDLVSGLMNAHRAYLPTAKTGETCVLIVVQPFNFNIADERPIEAAFWDRGVPCYRCEWQTVLQQTTLAEDRTLLFKPPLSRHQCEVSVVYHRAGYDPAEYRHSVGRETRLRLELSRAVKCPDVLTHISTFKAVQQALSQPGAVERFLKPEQAAKIQATFVAMHTLDVNFVEGRAIARDERRASDYVLKPNLEGGGHNVYRNNIPLFLSRIPEDQWRNYILMKLIQPPEDSQGTLMTLDDVYEGPVVSELGVLGTCLWKTSRTGVEIVDNNVVGWTFKTKPRAIDEMSVVKGYGCFDCPRLYAA